MHLTPYRNQIEFMYSRNVDMKFVVNRNGFCLPQMALAFVHRHHQFTYRVQFNSRKYIRVAAIRCEMHVTLRVQYKYVNNVVKVCIKCIKCIKCMK